MYVNLANQSVTYVSGTFVTLASGLNNFHTEGGWVIHATIDLFAEYCATIFQFN
jgi:hypothetical protein